MWTMKTVHRLCAILALGLLLWMGLSGVVMQGADLAALHSHASGDDDTMMSVNEGRWGGGPFAVITKADFRAPALPANLDVAGALSHVMNGFRQATPAAVAHYVELRVEHGQVVGQIGTGPLKQAGIKVTQPVAAFAADTGAPVAAVATQPISPPPPPSLRATGMEFHRYFSHGAGIGVWLMLLSGIVMWVMIVTGLVFYFRLLKARRRIGRNQLFWKAGDWWRTLHRGVSVASAFFMVVIAFTGTWMAFESVWHSFNRVRVEDRSSPLDGDQVQQMAAVTLKAFHAQEPDATIKVLRLRIYSGMPQGVVIAQGDEVDQWVYNAVTGARASLTEAGYPPSPFPFGDQMHETMKRIHSGAMLGLPARWLDLLAGLGLVYLCVSGAVMYAKMWLMRRKSGRNALVWS